jgi:hypothetical protein
MPRMARLILFDYPWAGNEFYDSTGVAKHRLVLSGIYSPGWDLIFSSKLILASPMPHIVGESPAMSPANGTCTPITGQANCGDLRAYYDPVTPDGFDWIQATRSCDGEALEHGDGPELQGACLT